jgi:CheY-like chemotaxis protein/prolyl-tRNA editing enzyme YbaK/EbsC (Cys-tRNA(Pro) deacylase)
VAKTIVLVERGRPVLVVLRQGDRLDLRRVRGVLGDEHVRFASDEEIGEWFRGCEPMNVPPLPIHPSAFILMDRRLACLGSVWFRVGADDTGVSVRFRDWYKAVRPGVGRFVVNPGPAKQPKPAHVLVVEDEADTNDLLCRLLEQQGFACLGAEHGQGALALADEAAPAAILLDLMLPDMSGFEVYERLRRHGPIKRIPMIVVSALDDDASRQRSEELGADAYLTKPFLPEDLIAEVEGLLADARA